MQFDHIPFEELKGDWHKLGSGSFGNVYKGTYLGTDVAIKEVLPSNDYDVRKYFEREWKLMREARHPNVVLFLGLSSAPDGRVFIISEYIENGNLRQYILSRSKPFPWRLRVSFCIDIARALAYLHARKCVHRDIKGENLLLTSNGRLKITDFGFARITPRSPEEAKRLTYCGTDAYMSPEILMGDPFDLPTDVFSLGIIYCEIICRKVADDRTFKRAAPMYSLDAHELHAMASPGCPPDLAQLALDCCSVFPANRPSMVSVLARLSEIEAQVLARVTEEPEPVGTLRFFTAGGGPIPGSRRPRAAPRIPSFGMGIGASIKLSDIQVPAPVSPADVPASPPSDYGEEPEADEEAEQDEVENVIPVHEGDETLPVDQVGAGGATVKRTPSWAEYGSAMMGRSSIIQEPSSWSQAEMIPSEPNSMTNLIDQAGDGPEHKDVEEKQERDDGSTITVRASHETVRISPTVARGPSAANGGMDAAVDHPTSLGKTYVSAGVQAPSPTVGSEHSAQAGSFLPDPVPSQLPATASVLSQASSRVLVHRFTLIKPNQPTVRPTGSGGIGWSPLNFFFSALNKPPPSAAKCDLCARKMGKAAALECDDCGMRCHVKCGEGAPRDCGVRFPRAVPALPTPGATAAAGPKTPPTQPVAIKTPPMPTVGLRTPPGSPGRWRRSPKMAMLGL